MNVKFKREAVPARQMQEHASRGGVNLQKWSGDLPGEAKEWIKVVLSQSRPPRQWCMSVTVGYQEHKGVSVLVAPHRKATKEEIIGCLNFFEVVAPGVEMQERPPTVLNLKYRWFTEVLKEGQ